MSLWRSNTESNNSPTEDAAQAGGCRTCPQSVSLQQSYADCRRIARKQAGNFYYAFMVLPKPQHDAMCALYSFLRYVDDLGDADRPEADRRDDLQRCRSRLNEAVAGQTPAVSWWRGLSDTVNRYKIPTEYLHATIDGVMSDLTTTRYATFEDAYAYCYKVASAVGLSCLRIWECDDPRSLLPGEWCGIAFQWTNILRDIVEDKRRGRIYLPQEDLQRFGVSEEELEGPDASPAFLALMNFEIERAREYYRKSAELVPLLDPKGRAVLQIMTDVYQGLLNKIAKQPERVLRERVSLSPQRKLAMVLRALPTRYLSRSPVATSST